MCYMAHLKHDCVNYTLGQLKLIWQDEARMTRAASWLHISNWNTPKKFLKLINHMQ